VLLLGAGAASLATGRSRGQPSPSPITLLNAPLEVKGEWGKSPPRAATAVISRMREACLAGIKLLSDQQPSGLRVENHTSGSPAIWLHDDDGTIAWIIVNIGERDWSKLAYQFGHELGHVLANSGGRNSKRQRPCQWLEEALVEALFLRGLGKLADSWEHRPPFKNDAPFANAPSTIPAQRDREIREDCFRPDAGFPSGWLVSPISIRARGRRRHNWPGTAAVTTVLHELETDARSVEDMGALNRWVGRSAVPIERYLRLWTKSCDEIGSAGQLPKRLVDLLGLR
jgi:hypothetical protein